MKKRKLLHTKRFGDLGEVATIFKAMLLGFIVAKPFGDNDPFDLVFCWPATGRLTRIQVKCTAYCEKARFQINMHRRHHRYVPAKVDFIVAYIVPCDTWYIVPTSKLPDSDAIYFFPMTRNSRCWTQPYREAWNLLK